MKITKRMVERCFELQNAIPADGLKRERILLGIESTGDNTMTVIFKEDGNVHASVFKLTGHYLTANGEPFISWSPFIEVNYRKAVLQFCREFHLEMPDEPCIWPWTSCDDEEPAEDGEYIIAWYPGNQRLRGKKALYEFCEFSDGEWLTDSIYQGKAYGGVEVVAWMPMPEQYEAA